jgi:hypothetical protein
MSYGEDRLRKRKIITVHDYSPSSDSEESESSAFSPAAAVKAASASKRKNIERQQVSPPLSSAAVAREQGPPFLNLSERRLRESLLLGGCKYVLGKTIDDGNSFFSALIQAGRVLPQMRDWTAKELFDLCRERHDKFLARIKDIDPPPRGTKFTDFVAQRYPPEDNSRTEVEVKERLVTIQHQTPWIEKYMRDIQYVCISFEIQMVVLELEKNPQTGRFQQACYTINYHGEVSLSHVCFHDPAKVPILIVASEGLHFIPILPLQASPRIPCIEVLNGQPDASALPPFSPVLALCRRDELNRQAHLASKANEIFPSFVAPVLNQGMIMPPPSKVGRIASDPMSEAEKAGRVQLEISRQEMEKADSAWQTALAALRLFSGGLDWDKYGEARAKRAVAWAQREAARQHYEGQRKALCELTGLIF